MDSAQLDNCVPVAWYLLPFLYTTQSDITSRLLTSPAPTLNSENEGLLTYAQTYNLTWPQLIWTTWTGA